MLIRIQHSVLGASALGHLFNSVVYCMFQQYLQQIPVISTESSDLTKTQGNTVMSTRFMQVYFINES